MKRRTEEQVEIVDMGAKGKVIGKKDGVVYLIEGGVPGDVVSIDVRKKRKGMLQGKVLEVTQSSPHRVQPRCAHQKHCGGCSWQELSYERQLELKHDRVHQQINRIAGIKEYERIPILGAPNVFEYRNKLEFTFVNEGWLTPDQITSEETIEKQPALGFHVPGRFDWVLHIDQCHLEDDLHNAMRQFVYERSLELNLPYYDPRSKEGLMRNIVLRKNKAGEWMILLITSSDEEGVRQIAQELKDRFDAIQSIWLILNDKVNDSYSDCPMVHLHGNEHLIETFHRADGSAVKYLIGPKSFFQTNSDQAERLYQIVYDWAEVKEDECVYDLYTGTGSIALFVADKAKQVVGIEYVQEAIDDAHLNSALNQQDNCSFFAGDMKDVLTPSFIAEHGKPDVLIADPPRAGMHESVIERILEAEPKRVVYVSCDPATQARDLALLQTRYSLIKAQAVDMFPHTSHVENVALLHLRA